MRKNWRSFWSAKTVPLHEFDTKEFYRLCAQELKILFGDLQPTRVLELGCGNGALFDFLGFDETQYKGVDFSPGMLAEFKARHPNVALECSDASAYVDRENKYDLVFSNGVILYFDPPMLDRHFANARAMMRKDSLFICAQTICRSHRSAYDSGALWRDAYQPSVLRWIWAKVRRVLWGDRLGRWYAPRDIAALAEKHGFSAKFYGSMAYMNAFSAVLKFK